MATRCNRGFLLQILLLAQLVSGTTRPIIRSSRVLYCGCCLWYLVLWFSSCWSGVELRVMCPVCRMLQHPANRTRNPYNGVVFRLILLKPKLVVVVCIEDFCTFCFLRSGKDRQAQLFIRLIAYVKQGCTKPGRQVTVATKFPTVVPNIVDPQYGICFGSSFWRLAF